MRTRLDALGDHLHVTEWLPRFDSAENLAALERWITKLDLEVVMIDPVYRCTPAESAANLFGHGTGTPQRIDSVRSN